MRSGGGARRDRVRSREAPARNALSRRFLTDAGPLDVVPRAAGVGGFEDVATVELALGELAVRVITIDEVIASKEKLGRPKDVAALPALHATREALRRNRDSKS